MGQGEGSEGKEEEKEEMRYLKTFESHSGDKTGNVEQVFDALTKMSYNLTEEGLGADYFIGEKGTDGVFMRWRVGEEDGRDLKEMLAAEDIEEVPNAYHVVTQIVTCEQTYWAGDIDTIGGWFLKLYLPPEQIEAIVMDYANKLENMLGDEIERVEVSEGEDKMYAKLLPLDIHGLYKTREEMIEAAKGVLYVGDRGKYEKVELPEGMDIFKIVNPEVKIVLEERERSGY